MFIVYTRFKKGFDFASGSAYFGGAKPSEVDNIQDKMKTTRRELTLEGKLLDLLRKWKRRPYRGPLPRT